MPDPSRREAVIAALASRAEVITTANGFNTDIGATLAINELPQFGPDDPRQALVLLVGDDEVTAQGHGFILQLPLAFLVLVDADLDEGWRTVEQGIADVKRAVELDDRTLGGLTVGDLERQGVEIVPREPGSAAIAGVVNYTVRWKEGWGAP